MIVFFLVKIWWDSENLGAIIRTQYTDKSNLDRKKIKYVKDQYHELESCGPDGRDGNQALKDNFKPLLIRCKNLNSSLKKKNQITKGELDDYYSALKRLNNCYNERKIAYDTYSSNSAYQKQHKYP